MNEQLMKEQDIINSLIDESETEIVGLSDKICVGCNHCGNCCINADVKLNSFDIYNIFKYIDNKEEFFKNIRFYLGDNSYLPMISIKNNEASGLCYFVKNINGDFKCTLGDDKPTCCIHSFMAISMKFDKDEFSFVPFNKEVPKFNVEEFLKNHKLENSLLLYLKDRNERTCKAPKEETEVREYLKQRINFEKERTLSSVFPLIVGRYINVKKLYYILYLAENSKINENPLTRISKNTEEKLVDRVMKIILKQIYLFVDDKSDKTFFEQITEHIEYLENTLFLRLRVLYKYLVEIFDPDGSFFDSLLKLDNIKEMQKQYDDYFTEHINETSERFTANCVNMLIEISKIKEK